MKISFYEIIILFLCICSINVIRLGNSYCINIYLSFFIMFMCIRCFKKMVKMEFLNMKYICNYMYSVVWGIDG